MSLRPLAALPLNIACAKEPGKPPVLDWLFVKQLRIDDSFQRDISSRGRATITRICNEFSWARFAPLLVARVPDGGGLHTIIDGQHRATAALMRGYKKVPCAIVDATALEQPAIFAAVNGDVTPVTILQLFKAARAAKTEWALELDKVCADAGLVPLVYPKPRNVIKPFETMALGTLRKSIMRFGAKDVTAALRYGRTLPGADQPGFWKSAAIDIAIGEWRSLQDKRKQPEQAANAQLLAERIRELKKRGHTRFAIQSALGCKLAEIEAALRGV
jgi:hypothetical protein